MIVNQGLLVKMPKDEQLATVLAHEIGHAVKRHWARRLRRDQTDTLVDVLGSVLLGDKYWAPDRTLLNLSFSREHEYESDTFGTELYLRAGFPPDQAARGMEVFVEESAGSRPPEYLNSHPDPVNRVKRIKALVATLRGAGLASDPGQPVEATLRSVFGELPVVAAEGNPYMPMTPGTSWTYAVTSGRGEASFSVRVVGRANVLASAVSRLETMVGEKAVAYQICADDQNVYRRNRPDKPESPWVVELLIPEFGGAENHAETQYRHTGTEGVVNTAGIFTDCMKLEIKDRAGRDITAWYAKDVGLVKRVNNTAKTTEELSLFRKG